ncbi:unnamed protein product [Sphagnum jensenii]|uniref:Uncharacterized protein n=1 Tax=Sphagnum jensenii TaxID=128206 RepID=A0ABP1AWX5_9BRYO
MAIRSLKSFTRSLPTKDGLGFSVATPSMSFASPPAKPSSFSTPLLLASSAVRSVVRTAIGIFSSTISCSNSCWIGKEHAI